MFKHIENQVNDSLQQEVVKEVKETMQEKIESEVYSTYTPKFYQRRGSFDGGLGDISNMTSTLIDNGVLEVRNETKINPLTKSDGSYFRNAFPSSYGLAEIVEYGNSNGIISNPARPFMSETTKELENGDRLIDVMRKGLRKRGIDVE